MLNKLHFSFLVATFVGVVHHQLNGVFHARLFLEARATGVHAAFCKAGITARNRHFFKNDNFCSLVSGTNCCRHAGATGPYNHDVERTAVKLVLFFLFGKRVWRSTTSKGCCRSCSANSKGAFQKRTAA